MSDSVPTPSVTPAMQEMPKAYAPAAVEKKWRKIWDEKKVFHAPDKADPSKEVFSMVIPPPNVTGALHMGHALNNTIQDILTRYYRMNGRHTLWMPGTDHAGIATQNVVEKALRKEGTSRADLGREKFVDRVWQWRDQYGNRIIEQLQRLGCSCDWDRIRFTMDEGLSRAVKEVFVRLYDKGLIYRSNYIINWCTRCQTALSDEEAAHRDVQGAFYHLRYTTEDGKDSIVIATTRPETLLGDTAVGFHPEDERYKHLIGKSLVLPLLGRKLRIIQDAQIDPAFGTGALKITPAHDPVDFDLGKKHGLDSVNILNTDGTLNANAGPYQGMDRFAARKKIIEDLKEKGILLDVKEHTHSVGHCYRCDTIVEPYCSDQWFVKMKPLAGPAIEAVESGHTKFHPERWSKTYMEWMTNIRDWCISRQIWWGHRIPVYYATDGRFTAALDEADARKRLNLPADAVLRQDEDVLDTWFSSWLWPFSTLGWPDKTEDLKQYYPTLSLVTGYEIIFFWVARMMMAGSEFMGQPPFKDIYIHGIVRASDGSKMSKSKGNVVDPIEIIDEFGADGLRYGMIQITSEGQDVYASKDRFEIGRNFANKIWNATRFALMNLNETSLQKPASEAGFSSADRWILSRYHSTVQDVSKSIETYRFHEASSRLYDFFWSEVCDWYLELSKPRIQTPETQWTLRTVLEGSMHLLHPLMPFITEELWEYLRPGNTTPIAKGTWPTADAHWIRPEIEEAMQDRIQVIQAVRNIRASWKIAPKQELTVTVRAASAADAKKLTDDQADLCHQARIGSLTVVTEAQRPAESAVISVPRFDIFVELKGLVDFEAERKKVREAITQTDGFIAGLAGRLSNEAFVAKAPAKVIEGERARLAELQAQKIRLEETLKSLN